MNLEEFYCHETGLENADEFFHILKSQTIHQGNCTNQNYPCLKCEFEDLIHKFLVYKFGLVGFKLSINCPWSSEVCYSCFFKHNNLDFYVDWYDDEIGKIQIQIWRETDEDVPPMFYTFKPVDDAILELLTIIDKK